MSSNLRASDARQKSVFGVGDIKITASIWGCLSMWNASRVLTHDGFERYKQEKTLIRDMETCPVAMDRIKHKAAWVKAILNAIIKKEGSSDFLVGEASTNWPKIKQSEYKHGISVDELTRIIQEHREALKSWAQQQTQNKQKKTVHVQTVAQAEVIEVESSAAEEPAKLVVVVPESWEDIEDV